MSAGPLWQLWALQRQQWWSRDELRAFQDRQLRALVAHAYARVPYYRRLFDAHGIRPEDVTTVDELRRVPILSKQTVREVGPAGLVATGVDPARCVSRRTSGTTGEALTVLRTRAEDSFGELTYARALVSHGVRPWHREAFILERRSFPRRVSWMERLHHLRKTYIWIGADLEEQMRALRACRPHVLTGYTQHLGLLARAVVRTGERGITPRLVIGRAEQLDEGTRTAIKEAFGVDIVDKYGTTEASCVAWQCPQARSWHLSADAIIVEFLAGRTAVGPGEAGRVVVTPLYLRAMPLLRYDLGDIATPMAEVCPCGRGLPLMRLLQGRVDSLVRLPSGRVLTPSVFFDLIITSAEGIDEGLIVQEREDLIVVQLVVTRRDEARRVAEQVRLRIERVVRGEAAVRVEVVDRIDRAPDAKIRRVVSRVPVPF